MAEGFANCYGPDVLRAASRGIAPVPHVPGSTIAAMAEKNIDISGHISRRYDPSEPADIVVNMSDYRLPGPPPPKLIEWKIADPYRKPIEEFRKTRDVLENQVMALILALRKK